MKGRDKKIIIADKPGNLGNRLIVYSHVLAYAIEYNIELSNPAFDEHAKYFQSTSIACETKYPRLFLPLRKIRFMVINVVARTLIKFRIKSRWVLTLKLAEEEQCQLDDKFVLHAKYTFFIGWLFRSSKYIQKHKDFIIQFFKPTFEILQSVESFIDRLRKDSELLIGVHVRHGDYVNFMAGRYFYSIDQYMQVVNSFYKCLSTKSVTFIFFSNAPINIAELGAPSTFKVVLGLGRPVEDMYSLAKCDYILGPPSTFTHWASFYGEVPLYQIKDPGAEVMLSSFQINTQE